MSSIETLIEHVDLFIQNELCMAEYYEVCIEKFPNFVEDWTMLQKCEKKHAAYFEAIKRNMTENPADWEIGKFSKLAIKMMIDQTRDNLAKLKSDKISRNYAIHYIKDVESSLIESDLTKAFITNQVVFQKTMHEMQQESLTHNQILSKILQGLI